MIDSYY